jgi:hypothetical protein
MPPVDFSALVEDDGYLADLGNGVWLMDDHRWALKVWEAERKSQSYSLIHADYHWDSCYDFDGSKEMEQELMHSSPAQVAELVAKGEWIRYDSFIAPAIRRGLVHTVHFYCLQDSISDNALDSDFLAACGAKQILHSDAGSLAASHIEGSSIFDLCLDLFNRSDQWAEGELWPDTEIEQFLVVVRPLIQAAELVTISMSFNYSGTAADTRHLAEFVVPRLLSCRD